MSITHQDSYNPQWNPQFVMQAIGRKEEFSADLFCKKYCKRQYFCEKNKKIFDFRDCDMQTFDFAESTIITMPLHYKGYFCEFLVAHS